MAEARYPSECPNCGTSMDENGNGLCLNCGVQADKINPEELTQDEQA